MSDMQKVRVSLTDADGKVHEVVGWNYGGDSANGVHAIDVEKAAYDVDCPWYIEIDPKLTPFAVIQELPTGLGAVVEVRYPAPENVFASERFVRLDDWWMSQAPEVAKPQFVSDGWINEYEFTVLSEGIK